MIEPERDEQYKRRFLDALPNLRSVWPPQRQPESVASSDDVPLTASEMGLTPGFVAILLPPANQKPIPCLVTRVYDPASDDAQTIDGKIVTFQGVRPRVDLLWITEKSADEIAREHARVSELRRAHMLKFAAHEAVPAFEPPPVYNFEITRAEKVIHRVDAERACMIADGNTTNLVNVYSYVVVHSLDAR